MKRRLKQAAAGCALALSAAFGGAAAAQETAAPLTPVADIIGACVSASGKPVEIRMNDGQASPGPTVAEV